MRFVLSFFVKYFYNISGVLAMTSGIDIPGEIYAWTVVFLLPLNSALNPVLYTMSSISSLKIKVSQKVMIIKLTFFNEYHLS